MNLFLELTGLASLAAWIYLLFGRGGFWRIRETPPPDSTGPAPSVAAVIPARNEATVIGQAIASLLAQNYPALLRVVLVDDDSTDGTAAAAGSSERLSILRAPPLPSGWTGKLWALSHGVEQAAALHPDYILLTDADIVHESHNLAALIARAESERLDLVSGMVKLQCRTFAERALVPAFVFFFFMLYPPAWVARRDRKIAAAAGGCILIRTSALARIGGIAEIRSELIDDCALARAVKQSGGSVRLDITSAARSIRDYPALGDIRRMISRTAFTQLRHSWLLLAGTIAGMAVIYVAPPVLVFTRHPLAGLPAWILMSIAFLPVLRFYRRSLLWAPLLPAIALFYMLATVESAMDHARGKGGAWKGRVQDANRTAQRDADVRITESSKL